MKVRQATLPYPPAPPESVIARPWLTTDGTPLSERLLNWDPASDLHVTREVEVLPSRVTAACQLSNDSQLALVPQIRSDRTALRVVGEAVAIDPSAGVVRELVSLHVQGRALGGTITLTTSLIWNGGTAGGPLSPRRRGSELWSDEMRCVLEGSAARFPISPVAFSELPTLDPDAAWTLDWEPAQLDDPVLGAVRLLVNVEHPRIREAVVSGSLEPGADVVRSLIHFDVARTLIVSALRNDDFVTGADTYPEGSVGRAIADLLHAHWGESPESMASRLHSFPRRFEMELQARFHPVPSTP